MSCIAFHPTKHNILAVSFIEDISFDQRAEISGRSWETHVLIIKFTEDQEVTIVQVLETPMEVTRLVWHPERPEIVIGGCWSGQMTFWDLNDESSKIVDQNSDNPMGGDDDDDEAVNVMDDDSAKKIYKYRAQVLSEIRISHRMPVEDMKWMPINIQLTRKSNNVGNVTHIVTCGEDGQVLFWDVRNTFKENRHLLTKKQPFEPIIRVQLMRPDGSGMLGVTRLLFDPKQEDTLFWATSDEGDIVLADWSVKPPGGEGKGRPGAKKDETPPEYIQFSY